MCPNGFFFVPRLQFFGTYAHLCEIGSRTRAVILLSLKSFLFSSAVPEMVAVEDFNTKACDSVVSREALRALEPDSLPLAAAASWPRGILCCTFQTKSRRVTKREHITVTSTDTSPSFISVCQFFLVGMRVSLFVHASSLYCSSSKERSAIRP